MKNIITVLFFTFLSIFANGQTVCVYDTWKSILENKGDTVGNLEVTKYKKSGSYEIKCINKDKELTRRLENNTIAVKYGDTLLLSSDYAKRRLTNLSDYISLYGFMPLFVSEKIIYFYHINDRYGMSDNGILNSLGMSPESVTMDRLFITSFSSKGAYFIMDLKNKNVIPINYMTLSMLVDKYPAISESLGSIEKNRKNTALINRCFLEYVKAIHSDSTFNSIPFSIPVKKGNR